MTNCCPDFVTRLSFETRTPCTPARLHAAVAVCKPAHSCLLVAARREWIANWWWPCKKPSGRAVRNQRSPWSELVPVSRRGRRWNERSLQGPTSLRCSGASMAVSQPQSPPLVAKVNVQPLNVPLLSPFTVASAVVEQVNNVAVQVMLSTGHSGWGEISIMPPITAEDQPFALEAAKKVAQWLPGHAVDPWQSVLKELAAHIPGHQYAAVRAGFEMALLDALARSQDLPLWRFFGGASDSLKTDITIPICPPQEAAALAFTYKQQGFETIKTKVGKEPKDDIIRLRAIRFSHPQCKLILDANEGYTPQEALDVLRLLQDAGMSPILLEQPVARDDWEGLTEVTQQANRLYGVPVAADESCRSAADARRIAENGIANVLNIKLAKCGVADALETVAIAKEHGLELMMGGMVETRLAMGFAAHFVAGVGAFRYVDLDTPLLLASDPVQGGYTAFGPHYSLGSMKGHGASLPLQAFPEP